MKLWLDDERPAPNGWHLCKDPEEAIRILKTSRVEEISLDHDLGENTLLTGYHVAVYIENMARDGEILPIKWVCHSSNPVGRKRIEQAMCNADKYWKKQ
jgi:hypothetical protein